jgi:hypothetical protein
MNSSNDPWLPPDPPRPAAHGRLLAMARALLLSVHGPEVERPWGMETYNELMKSTRRLRSGDRDRLQGEIDRMVDELNGDDP